LGGKLKLPGDWVAQAYGAHAEETDESRTFGLINTAILAEALGNVPDNAATPFSAARDGFFNPYTGVASNPAAVTKAIGSGFSVIHGKSQVTTGNLQIDGTVLSLPGGALKVAVGADMRREDFERQGTNFLSTALPTPQAGVSGHRTVEAGFVEARIPVVGPDNVLPGVKALDLSLAARYEHYSDFGHTLNPKVGLTWAPADDLKVRASYGTSFRAPGLTDLKSAAIFQALQFPVGSARVLALALTGGNPNLRPETATSWTAGFDYAPAAVPGLKLSATWFDTNFKGRVDRPVAQNITGALTDPRFVDFVTHINPATSATDLALINSFLANPAAASAQGLFPATAYQAIVDIRQVNTGILDVEGLDLQGGYRHDAFGGRFDVGANASHLFHYDQSLTPTAASQQLAGTATFPAKWRARGTIDWTRDRFSLGGAVNFLSSFHDTLGVPIKSQTTLDLQARFAAPPGPFEHTRLTLSVRNVFDTAPPFYNNPFGFAYDATNADVIGRFVALQISRSW
jgi:outer membrane receptor protein involved in Fe transport